MPSLNSLGVKQQSITPLLVYSLIGSYPRSWERPGDLPRVEDHPGFQGKRTEVYLEVRKRRGHIFLE
jgi:hypothetical protein